MFPEPLIISSILWKYWFQSHNSASYRHKIAVLWMCMILCWSLCWVKDIFRRVKIWFLFCIWIFQISLNVNLLDRHFFSTNWTEYFTSRSNTKIVIAHKKVSVFKAIIPLWMNNTEKGNLTWFPFLEEIVGTDQSLLSDIASAIYIQELLKTFDGYFSTGNLESCDH